MADKKKPQARPFKKFYCDRDDVFLLPPLAFKLWMFYYRLEGANREGWAKRDTICQRCDLDKDTVTKWRKWLVANGWLKQVGTRRLTNIPVMRVTRGTIPVTVEKRGRSAQSEATRWRKLPVTDGNGNFPSPLVTETSRPQVTETSRQGERKIPARGVTGSSRADVDKNDVDKNLVDRNPVDGSAPDQIVSSLSGLSGSSDPPPGAQAEILEDGVLIGWQMQDGSEVMRETAQTT